MAKRQIELKGPQTRSYTFDRSTIDAEARTIEISFSSETADVERWFGVEILGHDPAEVRLGRLNNAGPLLMDHNFRDQVGVIEKAWIDEQTRKGRALVRFGKGARASEIWQDVQDGIRVNVSVTYNVHKYALVSEGTGGSPDVYRAIDWEPCEISFVSVPADVSVGVGRNQDPAQEVRSVDVVNHTQRGETDTMKCTICGKEMVNGACDCGRSHTPAPSAPQVDAGAVLTGERTRVKEINAIAGAFGHVSGVSDLARQFVENGQDVGAFQAAILERMKVPTPALPDPSGVQLNGREQQEYSIARGLLSEIGEAEAGFERDIHQTLEKKIGRPARGLLVPLSLSASRAATTGNTTTSAAGGALVATQLGPMIEILRNRMMCRAMGARVLSGLVGNVTFPRQIASAVLQWVAQNGGANVSESDLANFFGTVAISPKSASATTGFTREMLIQATPDMELLIRDDLTQINAVGLDGAAIAGSGAANQPRGILNTTGIGSVVCGDPDGANPTWAKIVALETAVAVANADVDALGYLTSVQGRGYLKSTPKVEGTAGMMWEKGSEKGFGELNGYRAGATNQVPSNLTKGGGTNLSAAIFGNWNDLLIGEFGVLELIVDPYSMKKQGIIEVTSYMLCDVACRRPQSFAATKDFKAAA